MRIKGNESMDIKRIKHRIANARQFPYHGRKPKDNDELIALAVLDELGGRRGVGQELEQVEDDDKREMVSSLAAIVREARKSK